MGFNLRVILHVTGILLTILVLSWCLLNTAYYATMLTLTLLLGLQIFALLRYISLTNRELSRFLSAVKYADFSQSFRNRLPHTSFQQLGEAFDGVIERFRNERSDKESQAAYLQAFVQQLPIAVLALADDGRILVSNQAFLKFLGRGECRDLDTFRQADAALADAIENLAPGRDQVLKVTRPEGTLLLKVSCTHMRVRGQAQKLVSFMDIRGELENRELEAWQNLIRVMTHEIMNSITPITSLSDTVRQNVTDAKTMLEANKGCLEDSAGDAMERLEDAANAAATIGNRGQGLMRFVQSYRTLSRLPTPRPRLFPVRQLLEGIAKLMAEQAEAKQAVIHVRCKPETLELHADPELLEQALINLVRNAFEAMSDTASPVLTLEAEMKPFGAVSISVSDNGCGIEAANLEQIFVPFFTTKRGGNGIGMTIVRQIVKLNGGDISVHSRPGNGTRVTLSF